MTVRSVAYLKVCLLLAGCSERPDAAPVANDNAVAEQAMQQPPHPGPGHGAPLQEQADLESLLAGHVSMADARQALLDAGWTPVADPDCKRNVLGDDWQGICATDPRRCAPCEQPTGLVSAAADGHALFRFTHHDSGAGIEVTGMGLLDDWDVRGDASRLEYLGWRHIDASTP